MLNYVFKRDYKIEFFNQSFKFNGAICQTAVGFIVFRRVRLISTGQTNYLNMMNTKHDVFILELLIYQDMSLLEEL